MNIYINDGDYTDKETENFEKILNKKEVLKWFKDFEIYLNKENNIIEDIEYIRHESNLECYFQITQDLFNEPDEKTERFYIEDKEILILLDIENYESEECCYFICDYRDEK